MNHLIGETHYHANRKSCGGVMACLSRMPAMKRASLLLVGVTCSGCLQLSAVLKVNGDGSGTIVTRTVVLSSAADRLRYFAAANGQQPLPVTRIEPVPPDALRIRAGTLGMALVVATPLSTADGKGLEATFSFPDISKVDFSQFFASLIDTNGGFSVGGAPMRFELSR